MKFEVTDKYRQFCEDAFMRLVSRDGLQLPVSDQALAEMGMHAFRCAAFFWAAWELEKARLEGKANSQEREELAKELRRAIDAVPKLTPVGKAIDQKRARNHQKKSA